jgi:acyl-CoA synthetase (AMP-forming)/AMP-acid ligase II
MAFRVQNILDDAARERPDSLALVSDTGERRLTWRELDECADRVADALAADGVGPGDRVTYLDLNRLEFFELLFGCLRVGAVLAPLNWRLTPAELGLIVADAGARVLVVGERFVPALDAIRDAAPRLHRVAVIGTAGGAEASAEEASEGSEADGTDQGYEQWLATAPARQGDDAADARAADDAGAEASDAAIVLQLYTSGTTGMPKGVLLSQRNFATLTTNDTGWDMGPESVSLVAMPLFHIGGAGWALAGMIREAASVVVAEIEPRRLLDTLEQQRVTHTFLVPAVLAMLAAVPGAAERNLSALRCVVYGASPITGAVLERSLATLRAPHYQVYGLTETTGAITQLDASDHDPGGPRAHLLRSAGRPYPWVELMTVEPSTGEPARPGQVGEVWVRSDQVTGGYWNKPAESAAVLPGGGWFRSGDAGYLDEEGFLFLTDRIKDMIVTGGENVYPIEVEDALAAHPAVADVAVIGVPDERWGETVKAIVVRHPGAEVTEDELLSFARERLAGFKRPRSVDFIDVLPRNPTGKLLKKVLREPFWTGREGRLIG